MPKTATMTEPKTGAKISDCERYRYRLWRVWKPKLARMVFVMLNPSTADEESDDPTIRRCIRFAKREDHGGIEVVNLFAIRATDPCEMLSADEPVGPENDEYIVRSATEHGIVVCAWGNHGGHRGRDAEVKAMLASAGLLMKCRHFKKTANGQPTHPLFQRAAQPLSPFDLG